MGLGPVEASRQALRRAGMAISDIDLVEINEAFAAQVIPSYRDLGIDPARLNVNGGAIAVGHPFGMTGARIATTLLNSLQFHDKTIGLETMCVGGGQGMAMIFERLASVTRVLAVPPGCCGNGTTNRTLQEGCDMGLASSPPVRQSRLKAASHSEVPMSLMHSPDMHKSLIARIPFVNRARASRVVRPPGIRPRLPAP